MPGKRATSRESIVEAATKLVKRVGAGSLTIDRVAKAAGCAKGLVHYHLKTKQALLEAVAHQIAAEREANWLEAFGATTPKQAVRHSWELLTRESADGTIRGWVSLLGSAPLLADRTVSKVAAGFSVALSRGALQVVSRAGRSIAVRPAEIGWLLAAVVDGIALQLSSGADLSDLEGAYAAAWLGILSLGEG